MGQNQTIHCDNNMYMHTIIALLIIVSSALAQELSSLWDWDKEVVRDSLWNTENIMIGVGAGLFNFIFGTLAWFTVSQIYSLTAQTSSTSRQMYGRSLTEAASEVFDIINKFETKY